MDANTSVRDIVLEEHERTLQQLEAIWDELGLLDDQRRDRREAFHNHILNLCQRILDDEKALRARINNRIVSNTQKIIKLSEELCVTPPEDGVDGLALLDLDALLQERLDKLEQTKEERLETLKELQEKDEGLCELLCETPYFIPQNLVPTLEDISNVEKHIKSMEKEKEERERTFATLKAGVVEFLQELEQSPEDSFLQQVVCSDEDEDVPLGKADLQQLRTVHSDLEFKVRENEAKSLELRETIKHLWDLLQVPMEEQEAFLATAPKHTPSSIAKLQEELRRLRVLRQQNLSLFIEKLQEELTEWWEKCFVGELEREGFTSSHPGTDEEVLDAYEKEVQKWKKFHQDNYGILEMVNQFLSLYVQMWELEEKAKDPSRLFNTRGGALLQEEKAKKKVRTELPRVETRLVELGKEWEEREGKPFGIYGTPLEEHIKSLWEKHEARREQEKNKKQNEKSNLDSKPRMYKGTTPAKTPILSRKRMHGGEDPVSSKKPKHGNLAPNPSPTKLPPSISPLKGMQTPRARPLTERNCQVPEVLVSKPSGGSHKPTEELQSTITYDTFEEKLRSSNELLNSTMLESRISENRK
ncbi:protein regulator of cytokinesis 1-like isoform X2 [Macrobrachium rosenbergii]|uniref:protein regulator of cytokinesis 1-like isoform X2 n=1 Tax=Macrobrachium rosenbergii TaxID=79674 RepID=UPI0034D3F88E